MALLLGLLGSEEKKPSLIRTVLQWLFLGLLFSSASSYPWSGPPIWLRPCAGAAWRLATAQCALCGPVDAPVAVSSAPAVRVPVFGTVVRTLFLVVVPVVVALIALGFDVRLGGGKLLTAGLLFIAVSVVGMLAWFAYRWWRLSRASRG